MRDCSRIETRLIAMLVVGSFVGISRAESPLHERIDRAITAKMNGPVAARSSDAEFLRRVYLDFAGRIPSAVESRAFLSDTDAAKREKLIDRLLAGNEYPRRMQQVVSVMLLDRRPGQAIPDAAWNDYIRKAFADNKPWDAFLRDLIAADGRDEAHRPAIRFFADGRGDAHQLTRDIGRLFLGINFSCSQCHDDPNVADFKQADYFGVYTYLRQTQAKPDKLQKTFLAEIIAQDRQEFRSVLSGTRGDTGPRLPGGKEVAVPQFAKGQELAEPARDGLPGVPKFRPRQLLAADLTAATNQRFVRSSVNMFWHQLMGRGVVHPLDMMHADNPPSHPELIDALADEFVKAKFDVKHLLHEIALSEVYQRSSVLPAGVSAKDVTPASYRVAIPRPLSAEQLAFSAMQATGQRERLEKGSPSKTKFTVKDYVNGKTDAPENLPDVLTLFAATFGSPPGNPEAGFTPSVSQSLFLMNDKLILNWLDPQRPGLVADLAKQSTDRAIADELYLRVLVRAPTDEELATVSAYLRQHANRRTEALSELAWALLTSAEFRFNQ